MDIARILVPVDFDEHSEAAAARAVDLARVYDASVEVLHVVTPEPPPVAPVDHVTLPATPETLDDARIRLHAFVQGLGSDEVSVVETVDEGPGGQCILDHAEDADLIVMGTHGRRGISRMILGSRTEEVVRRAPVPVLVVK